MQNHECMNDSNDNDNDDNDDNESSASSIQEPIPDIYVCCRRIERAFEDFQIGGLDRFEFATIVRDHLEYIEVAVQRNMEY